MKPNPASVSRNGRTHVCPEREIPSFAALRVEDDYDVAHTPDGECFGECSAEPFVPQSTESCSEVNPFSSMAAAGEAYAGIGWPIFPVHTKNGDGCTCRNPDCSNPAKHPRTQHGFLEATNDPAVIQRWQQKFGYLNWGLAAGSKSGVFVIDIDPRHEGDKSWEALEAQHGRAPKTVEAKTPGSGGRGRHLFWRYPDDIEIRNREGGKGGMPVGLDVRGEGGYVIVAPSTHIEGPQYEWVEGQSPHDMEPAEPPAWVLDLVRAKEEAPPKTRSRGQDASDIDLLVEAATKYIVNIHGEEEGGRNSSAFSVAGHLAAFVVEDTGSRLTERQILNLMCGWNSRNNPPLSENELGKAVKSAFKGNGKPRKDKLVKRTKRKRPHYRADEMLPEPIHRSRVATDDERNGHAKQSEEQTVRKRFTIYTSAELDEMEFSESAIIENAMIESQPGGIFGGGKMLKTMIAMDAGTSVATATPFLGCPLFRAPRTRRVLIMSGESGLKALQRSARRIAQARGIERLRDIPDLLWSAEVPFLGTPNDPAAVEEAIKEHGIELLFLDPAYQMLDAKDSGNLFAQGIQLRRILDVCRRQSCDFQIIHHTTRAASKIYEPPTLNDASWAGFTEFVGQWMLIGRRQRYEPGSGVHRLWLELGARGEHQMGWAVDVDEHADERGRPQGWSVTVKQAADIGAPAKNEDKSRRQAEQLEVDKQAIVAAMVRMPGGTKTDIRDASGIRSVRFDPALAELIREGVVVQCSVKKPNNQTYTGYRLKDQK